MAPSIRRCLFLFALSGATCALLAQAPASNSLQESLRECAAVKKDEERLACFDKVAASLAAATVLEAETPAPAPQPPPKAQWPISATVTLLRELSSGELLIELDNGQSWRTLPEDARLLLKTGDTVTLSRGAFGSFRLATPGKRFARVTRVR